MKNYCVLCRCSLGESLERYRMQGNFCKFCIPRCEELSKLFPGESPYIPEKTVLDWENSKKQYERIKAKVYRRKLDNFREKKEVYERMSKRFQDSLLKSPLVKKHKRLLVTV